MLGGLGVVLVAVLAVGAVVFQPWLIFVDTEIDDAIPVAVAPTTSAPGQAPPRRTGGGLARKPDQP